MKFIADPNERIAVLVDGTNTFKSSKALKYDIDYNAVLEWATSKGILARAIYFASIGGGTEIENPIIRLLDYLAYNGWQVVEKESREVIDSTTHEKKFRAAWLSVDIAVTAMELTDHGVSHLMIFSGDGSLLSMVEAVQRRGVRVTIISTIKSDPAVCYDELRRAADNFIDLDDLRNFIMRKREVVNG